MLLICRVHGEVRKGGGGGIEELEGACLAQSFSILFARPYVIATDRTRQLQEAVLTPLETRRAVNDDIDGPGGILCSFWKLCNWSCNLTFATQGPYVNDLNRALLFGDERGTLITSCNSS